MNAVTTNVFARPKDKETAFAGFAKRTTGTLWGNLVVVPGGQSDLFFVLVEELVLVGLAVEVVHPQA